MFVIKNGWGSAESEQNQLSSRILPYIQGLRNEAMF